MTDQMTLIVFLLKIGFRIQEVYVWLNQGGIIEDQFQIF